MSYLHVYLNTIANICDSKKKKKERNKTRMKRRTTKQNRANAGKVKNMYVLYL